LTTKDAKKFLNSYYGNNYILGDNMSITSNGNLLQKSGTTEDISVATVTSQSEPNKTGYVVTENNSGNLIYFGETDNVENSFMGVDFDTADGSVAIIDIGGIGIGIITFPVDPVEPIYTTLGWRYSYGSCRNGFRGVYRTYYFLGIRIGTAEAVLDDNGNNESVGCNEEYDPNK